MKNHQLLSGILSVSAALAASSVMADDASTIEGYASQTTGVTYDNASGSYPVITSVLTTPGTVNGKSFTAYSLLAQDSTGSIEIYIGSSYLSLLGFTPAVGDAIQVSGEYYPYHGIPELEDPTSITLESTGNSVGNPITQTVSALNSVAIQSGASTLTPEGLAGNLVQLNNVTISGQTAGETFAGSYSADTALLVSDSTGSETLYYAPSTYSVANGNLNGMTIPSGPVDMIGIDSVYQGSPEFLPISITSVPEPATLSLCGGGALLALLFGRRRKA